jgi:RsiW-degrading membrane proteinase PrsW (M82 family)
LLATVVTLVGVSLAAGGVGSGMAYLLLALWASEATFPLTGLTTVAGFATLGLGLGGLLVWQGLRAWRKKPNSPLRLPHPVVLTIIFVSAVAVGQVVLSSNLAPRFLFPPFGVLAGSLPALFFLALVGRRLQRLARQREIVNQVSSGILLAGPGAILIVGLAGLALVVLWAALVALTPGGLEALQSLMLNLQDPAWLEDQSNLSSLVLTPAGLTGVFLLVVIIGPLIEELLKPIGVLFIWRRPGRAEAFLWGLAGASGFAAVEGMLNSTANLDAWLQIVLMRIGTSLIHCLAGGLVGLGWYALRTARRPWRAMGLYLSAVILHGTWNAVSLGVGGLSLVVPEIGEALAGLGIVLLLGILGLLILGGALALALLVRRLETDLPEEMKTVEAGRRQ